MKRSKVENVRRRKSYRGWVALYRKLTEGADPLDVLTAVHSWRAASNGFGNYTTANYSLGSLEQFKADVAAGRGAVR